MRLNSSEAPRANEIVDFNFGLNAQRQNDFRLYVCLYDRENTLTSNFFVLTISFAFALSGTITARLMLKLLTITKVEI